MSDFYTQLLTQLDTPGAKEKIAAQFGGYIRDHLRESSYAEHVLPPEKVDQSSCQRSVNHDSLVKILDLEPKSRAMVVSFRGQPKANFIRGDRLEVAFFTVMSEMFEKPEQEFMAYTYPIAKVLEQQSIRDLGEVQDREFTIHIESAVQAIQAEANGGSVTALNASALQGVTPPVESSVVKGEGARSALTDDATVRPIQRVDIVSLMKLLDGKRLESDKILMTNVDFDDLLQWTLSDNGDKVQSETVVGGYKYNTLLGKKFVRTIKTDLLRPGNVYCFTSPDFLGRFYVLNNVKFYIDKVINIIKWVSWKDIGMCVANISSVTKLELYSGDATTTDTDSILATKSPVAEEDMGAMNNRAANRQFYPTVVAF